MVFDLGMYRSLALGWTSSANAPRASRLASCDRMNFMVDEFHKIFINHPRCLKNEIDAFQSTDNLNVVRVRALPARGWRAWTSLNP